MARIRELKYYIILVLALVFFSGISVASKVVSSYSGSIIFWIGLLVLLAMAGIYSIMWQIVLEHIPLTVAYPFCGIREALVIVWSYLLFDENVTIGQIVGIIIILIGVKITTDGNR